MWTIFACTAEPILLDSGKDPTGTTAPTDSDPTLPTITETAEVSFELSVDADIATMVHVGWTWPGATDVGVEYAFEGETHLAPATADGQAVLLGIPAETEVEVRLVGRVGASELRSETQAIRTGELPRVLLQPEVRVWEEDLAYDADYAMISVAHGDYTYSGPYYIQIFDRQGRIVWYHEVPDDLLCFYPSPSRDGTHLWFEGSTIFDWSGNEAFVTRRTLDGRWESSLEVPGMGQAIAEGPDDSFFYEDRDDAELRQLDAAGDSRSVWDCGAWMRSVGVESYYCYMNTSNWDPTRNTVLTSMFYANTVWEIDVESGEPIRQMGQFTRGEPYDFDPPESVFDYQHNPYWLDNGNLLVSTHRDGERGVQVAAEYEVDDASQTLTRVWDYTSEDLWAEQVGEAIRLANGNTIQGYGQNGAVREVSPEGEVAWEVRWEADQQGYRVVGHLSLIPDLYALNAGPS